jgi:hypothetical protein
VSQFLITEEIEQAVIDGIFSVLDRLLRTEGRAPAPWVSELVTQSCSDSLKTDVAPGYVVGLMWELIDQDKIRINIRGELRYGAGTH